MIDVSDSGGSLRERDREVLHLRRCLRELAALSALPATWIGCRTPEVLASFLDILLATLCADFAYAMVRDPHAGTVVQASQLRDQPTADTQAIASSLAPLFGAVRRGEQPASATLPHPIDGDPVAITVIPFGRDELGGVIVGARREDFPAETESTLLGAAINHIATWLGTTRRVLAGVHAEAARQELEDENAYLREEVNVTMSFGRIVGQSAALRIVLQQVELVARTEASVLLVGESGTGKELVAREIHERSSRAERPLIKVNCSAIPREMFESEFFGHVRGSFTGAFHDRPGRFQLANGGTLFLDEVGDLPIDLQPKLLRVLQEGQYERVGDDMTRQVNVRVITATNRNLAEEVRAGRFRADLYYRLSVFPIELPPLRARKEDIPLLAAYLIPLIAKRLNVAEPRASQEQWNQLQLYDWPGNVRELKNVIERAVILSRGGQLRFDLVLPEHATPEAPSPPTARTITQEMARLVVDAPAEIVTEREWRRQERANILAALRRTQGRIYGEHGAAHLLGVKPSTLSSRMKALKIRADEK